MKKVCSICKIKKSSENFYWNKDRLGPYCKSCAKKKSKKYYQKNREKMKAWQAWYSKLPHRKERDKVLRQDPKKKARHNEISGRWQKKNRHKARAYWKVWKAKKDGKLKAGSCFYCGTDRNIHAHHKDYSKPLDVLWVCVEHHEQIHHTK